MGQKTQGFYPGEQSFSHLHQCDAKMQGGKTESPHAKYIMYMGFHANYPWCSVPSLSAIRIFREEKRETVVANNKHPRQRMLKGLTLTPQYIK